MPQSVLWSVQGVFYSGADVTGGIADSIDDITGGIAEAFYGMPQELRNETLKCLPEDLRAALFRAGAFL